MNIPHQAARLAESCARHPWRILSLALFLSVLAGWATAHLPIYTSRQALLPKNTAVAERLDDFLNKFGAATDLMVVLEGAPPQELEAFATELATQLRTQPEIAQATERLDIQFLLDHAYLMAPAERLEQLHTMVRNLTAPASSRQPFSLDRGLRQALGWITDHPPLGEIDLEPQAAEKYLKTLSFFLEEWKRWLTSDPTPGQQLDWGRLMAQHGAAGLAKGYFSSRDGRMLFLFVRPKNPSEDFQAIGPFIDKVKAVAAAVTKQAEAAGRTPPLMGLTGLPAIEYEEFTNIRSDITLVIWTAAVLIALLILLVVRSFRWAVIIFVPMGLGVLWSLGLALVTVGHLTVITAAFIAILFGLGADYGIFTSSRIAEERRAGKPLIQAIGAGIGSSFGAVLTAGGASLLIFGTLTTVDFPGFAELGMVAAKGVLLILVSTWLVQPALYALMPPKLKISAVSDTSKSASGWLRLLAPIARDPMKGSGAFPRPVALALVLVALGCALIGTARGLAIPFDYDVLSLLPKDSQAAHYQRRMVAESDYQAEVVIFTARDLPEARRIGEEASQLKTIAQVQSLTQLFPEDANLRLRQAVAISESFARWDAANKISELERAGLPVESFDLLRALLEKSSALIDEFQEQAFSAGHANLVKGLEKIRLELNAIREIIGQDDQLGRTRSALFWKALLDDTDKGRKIIEAWRQAKPLSPEQLPPSLKDRFFADDGSIAIYAFPAKTVYDPDNLDELIREVYRVSPQATGFPTTHQAFSKSVVESFRQGTQLALLVCLIWIMLVLRSLPGFILASLPLLIGGGWMLGLMSLSGIKYNYANIIALPLVIALAVDYGVWFSYRWRELKDNTPLQVTLIAGRVIGLAAGTELAGLGAITLASYRGVSTMGVSITIGLICCLAATLLVGPAIGQLFNAKRKT